MNTDPAFQMWAAAFGRPESTTTTKPEKPFSVVPEGFLS